MARLRLQKVKKSNGRIGNTLTFFLAFILFLVVFGGLCLWAVVNINSTRFNESSSSSSSSASSTVESFDASDTRNLLIVTTDSSEPQGFIAVRIDPANIVVRAMAFPRDTVVYYGTSEKLLYEMYDSQGISETKSALEKLCGITFNNYAVVTYSNIEKIIDYFESNLIFNVPEDVDYSGNDFSLRLSSGLRTLTAKQTANMLRYSSWSGGRKQTADIQAQVIAALINQYLTTTRTSEMDDDFKELVNQSKTDVLISHYNSVKSGLVYLANCNTGGICTTLSLDGEYEGSDDTLRFYASDSIMETLDSTFG